MTCGVHRAPVGWERSVYGVDSRDDEWIKVEFSAADVPNVKRALATAAASHPSVFKGAGGTGTSRPACSKDSGFTMSDAGKSPLAALKGGADDQDPRAERSPPGIPPGD